MIYIQKKSISRCNVWVESESEIGFMDPRIRFRKKYLWIRDTTTLSLIYFIYICIQSKFYYAIYEQKMAQIKMPTALPHVRPAFAPEETTSKKTKAHCRR